MLSDDEEILHLTTSACISCHFSSDGENSNQIDKFTDPLKSTSNECIKKKIAKAVHSPDEEILHLTTPDYNSHLQSVGENSYKTYSFSKSLKSSSNMCIKKEIPRTVPCSICFKQFPNKFKLKQHYHIHTGETPFQCHCGKKFNQQCNLKVHQEMHRLEKTNILCEVCHRSYSNKSNFKRHVCVVENVKREFSCALCKRKFNRLYNLNFHTCANSKKCENCSKSFSKLSELKRHMISHVELKPFTCNICYKHVSSKYSLERHIARKHK